MGRNLILCCDGTSNRFTADRTNVLKLCYALQKDPEHQLVYYHPGLGTRAPVGVTSSFGGFWSKLGGLAFGLGLKADVADAYIYLMNHYRPGDRVFLFGFSRGAYTARVVASMLKLYGLVMPGNEALIPYAVDMMWAISKGLRGAPARPYFELAKEFRATLSPQPCKPHFLGVWDTVSSVGWITHPLSLPYTRENADIGAIRHAMAIDERRAFFRVSWFQENEGDDIKQVWFPGAHSDVGGGYPEATSWLSKYPLAWMASEAQAAGLLIDADRLDEVLGNSGGGFAKAEPHPIHNALTGLWHIFEFVPRARWDRDGSRKVYRINFYRRRTMPKDAVVHDVAWEMPDDYAARLPSGAVPLSKKQWNFETQGEIAA